MTLGQAAAGSVSDAKKKKKISARFALDAETRGLPVGLRGNGRRTGASTLAMRRLYWVRLQRAGLLLGEVLLGANLRRARKRG